MEELTVRFNGQKYEIPTTERLGFGRSTLAPDKPRGWGYPGRFVELDAVDTMHRVWGELIWSFGTWNVRSLGRRDGVSVRGPAGQIDLAPHTAEDEVDGIPPEQLPLPWSRFTVLLDDGQRAYALDCEWQGARGERDHGDYLGDTTRSRADLSETLSEIEYQVLWAMSREYRLGTGSERAPEPLSYSRVAHVLGLSSPKPAIAAIERVVRRLRVSEVMPARIDASEQRSWLCRQMVAHRSFTKLAARYGVLSD